MKNKKDIISIIESDDWMMSILELARTLQLPDWWICAGFVRTKIWDHLHGFEQRTPLADIDLIYFDSLFIDEGYEKELEKRLLEIKPEEPWSVKNQARMHVINDTPSYHSSADAISKFPETATAIGLKLDRDHALILKAPYGVGDVMQGIVAPTPHFQKSEKMMRIFEKRKKEKQWKKKWPMLSYSSRNKS
ncbi:hypothetical protein HNR44_002399 [Geomicrobium halophilum]|uniref:Nucleotidyltransferase family protein n=1 Tax=Geomicrobium halophilum TaxID=549000 RepID=A0A841PTA7_9BACL|nr:nucleotidyltransferase family protein [Geomicrobium halophilum]MBB6450416.1 hypothetical protein [Geomicrobium halophilum]